MLAGTTRKYTHGTSGSNTGKQRTVICYNCKGEGHIAKQCTKPKRKRDETWFNDKVLLVQAQASGQALKKAEITFWQIQDFPYIQTSQTYLSETQQETVQNSNSSAQQDVLILSMFEQLRSNEQYAEIVRLKETLFEQVQEKDSLMKTVSDLKKDLKMEENRNIDREIALEKKIKQLDNIIFKRGQSAQTEQGLVIAALKNELRKLKGKALDKEATETHSVDPKVSKDNMEPITPKLLNKRTAHSSYIKHTQEEALVLRDIVEHVKANYPQDSLLESAFRYTKVIQDLLSHISRSCPSINNFGPQLVEVTPRKKDKKVRFAESLTSTENTKTDSPSNIVSNKRVLHSTGVRLSTSASGSQPSGNTRNDRILQTPSSNSTNKVEAHPRNVKSSLNKRNGTVKVNGSASVQYSKKHDNSDYVCINGDDCMSSDNLCVSNSMNDVKFRAKSKTRKSKKEIWKPTGKVFNKMGYIWRPTGRTFTIVGNACPLTRITTTNEVPSRKPIVLDSESPKPVVKLVYSRKPRKNKNTESVSKTKFEVLPKLKFEKWINYVLHVHRQKFKETPQNQIEDTNQEKTISVAYGDLVANACRKCN
ncbi:retrovirus-related pol polyprotein from transposon TNT 1-94 [Tanacetum coccineum]|uniref:Retrovirus-related pol polyprotein from transposon TNT 1-94 n=1 Tax=Tanacetum coccineum TaxID=301880 RepID=A0ABQ5GGW1_9ASTR